MLAGTRVAGAAGWQPVETLQPGDKVLTFDNGLQPVLRVRRTTVSGHGASGMTTFAGLPKVLQIPAGVIGNCATMQVLPRQGLLVKSRLSEQTYGKQLVLIHAGSLLGYCGVTRMAQGHLPEICLPEFEIGQVVFCSSGALSSCPALSEVISENCEAECGTSEYRYLTARSDRPFLNAIIQELVSDWRHNRNVAVNGL
ncbi:Hint domain-containing protein [Pseudooceanicola algae]|nr:Hint domain-containing protein [Pseudooceanicola algae]